MDSEIASFLTHRELHVGDREVIRVMFENTFAWSHGLPSIATQQTTKAFAALDRPCPVFIRWRDHEFPADALMRALPVVVRNVLTHSESEMALAEENEPIQTLALDGQDESFRVRV